MSASRAKILELIVDRETPAGLDLWPAIQARLGRHAGSAGSSSPRRHSAPRGALAGGFVAVLLLLATIFIYPPAHAWAQGALDGLLAAFRLDTGQQATPVAQVAGGPAAAVISAPVDCVPNEQGQSICFTEFANATLTREQAAAEAGFAPRLPTYLPAGYHDGGEFAVGGTTVSWDARLDGDVCPSYVTLAQSPASGSTMGSVAIGDAQATAITVSQAPGLWVASVPKEKACRAADGKSAHSLAYNQSILAWEQDGMRYWLFSDASLGLDEMLKIAESLK